MRHLSRFHRLISIAAFGFLALAVFLNPAAGSAQTANDYGLSVTANEAQLPNTDKSAQQIIGNVIGTALSLISVLFFALMLYAGLKWMLARGDSDEAKKALDTIVAAIIGMIIVLGSYAITSFVFKSLDGGTPTAGGGGGGGDGGAVATDKTKWISEEVNGQYCTKYYANDGFTCEDVANCIKGVVNGTNYDEFVAETYNAVGYGLMGSGGNYISNACPGTKKCCIK